MSIEQPNLNNLTTNDFPSVIVMKKGVKQTRSREQTELGLDVLKKEGTITICQTATVIDGYRSHKSGVLAIGTFNRSLCYPTVSCEQNDIRVLLCTFIHTFGEWGTKMIYFTTRVMSRKRLPLRCQTHCRCYAKRISNQVLRGI